MKFNAIIMNPPYGSLGTKILKTLVEEKVAKEVITIQPMHVFTRGSKNSINNKMLADGTDISKLCTSINFINGNVLWPELSLEYPVAITKFNINNTNSNLEVSINKDTNFFKYDVSYTTDNLSNIRNPKYSNPMLTKIFDKVQVNKKIALNDKWTLNKDIPAGEYGVNVFSFNGNVSSKLLTTHPKTNVYFGDTIIKEGTVKDTNRKISFYTETEVNNYIEFINSNFIKSIVCSVFFDRHINSTEAEAIPLVDFTKPVTDEYLQDTFNLTDVEMNFISDFGKQLNGGNVDWSKYE